MTRKTVEDLGSRAVPGNADGGEMIARVQEALRAYDALSPVDRALHDADQRRSFVRGQSGRDPEPDVLADEVRRLRAEVDAMREQSAWRPIEAAPKDGTRVLLFVPEDAPQHVVGFWEIGVGEAAGGGWWQYAEGLCAEVCGMIESEPTHWQPLTSPGSSEPPPTTEGRRANPENTTLSEVS